MNHLKIKISSIEANLLMMLFKQTLQNINDGCCANYADYFAIKNTYKRVWLGFEDGRKKTKTIRFKQVEAKWLFNYLHRQPKFPPALASLFTQIGQYTL